MVLGSESQSLVIESFSVRSRAVLSAEKLLMFRDSKKVVNVSLAFLRTGAVCDIQSVWVFCWIFLSKVEICPLFAALRVFCHTQHICNMHATSGCAATF